MNKPWFFVWMLSATVLDGMIIVFLLNAQSAQASLSTWMIVSSVVSLLVTVPFAIKVGKALEGPPGANPA